jgi:hypothetical protein
LYTPLKTLLTPSRDLMGAVGAGSSSTMYHQHGSPSRFQQQQEGGGGTRDSLIPSPTRIWSDYATILTV